MNIDFLDNNLPRLAKGDHEANSQKMCAMELVAYIEREEHSDHPECTCPVLAAYTRNWNDSVPDHLRNHILPILPQLVGTRNETYQIPRAEYFAFAARDFAVLALKGKVDATLIQLLKDAKTIDQVKERSIACKQAANAAANAADAAYAANAANAAANAAAYAAANAAAYAAYAANDQIWLDALDVLKGAIAVDPAHQPATWTASDYERGLAAIA